MTALEKWLVLGAGGATAITGLVYAWMRYVLEPFDEFAVIHHPWEPFFLKAHILVSPILVFAVGSVAVTHAWRHFRGRIRLGRRTGILTAGIFAPMALSGFTIQTVTSPSWITSALWLHVVASGLFIVGVALHFRESLRR
jgi:hypothetical protein